MMTLRELKKQLNELKDEDLDVELILSINFCKHNYCGYTRSNANIEFDGFDTLYGDMTDSDGAGS